MGSMPPINTLLAVIICTLATSFRMGYNMCMFNPTYLVLGNVMERTVTKHYDVKKFEGVGRDFLWSSATSIMFLFAAFGAITFTFCSIGRRTGLLISQVIFIFGSLISAFAYFDLFELLIIGQSFIGFALGFSGSVLSPYIDEISESSYASVLYTLVAIAIEIGTSMANLLGINIILGSDHLWPIIVIFPAIFNVAWQAFLKNVIFLLKSSRETPAHLIKQNKRSEALESVQFYFQLSECEAEKKLCQIEKTLTETGSVDQKNVMQALIDPKNRKAWLMCVLTSIATNFSGILAISISGSELMAKYGGFEKYPTTNGFVNFGVFATSLVGLLISIFTFQNVSHRKLLLIGLPAMLLIDVVFMSVALTLKGTAAFVILAVLIVLFCLAFSNSTEKIIWFGGSLITRPEFIDANSSIMVFSTYFTAFLAPLVYYPMSKTPYSFLLFIAVLIVAWTIFFVFYPTDKIYPTIEITPTSMNVEH